MPNYTPKPPKPLKFSRRWEAYRPTKGVWLWTGAGCIVATIVVGFAWGGWVTGGTATRMASDAADGARAQLAAMVCVADFNHGPDAVAQLAALKKASDYQRGDMLVKSGWLTMPGSADPVAGSGRYLRAEADERGSEDSDRRVEVSGVACGRPFTCGDKQNQLGPAIRRGEK